MGEIMALECDSWKAHSFYKTHDGIFLVAIIGCLGRLQSNLWDGGKWAEGWMS